MRIRRAGVDELPLLRDIEVAALHIEQVSVHPGMASRGVGRAHGLDRWPRVAMRYRPSR